MVLHQSQVIAKQKVPSQQRTKRRPHEEGQQWARELVRGGRYKWGRSAQIRSSGCDGGHVNSVMPVTASITHFRHTIGIRRFSLTKGRSARTAFFLSALGRFVLAQLDPNQRELADGWFAYIVTAEMEPWLLNLAASAGR